MIVLHSPFQIWMFFFFLFWLISLALSYGTILNRNGENQHSHLIPDLKELGC